MKRWIVFFIAIAFLTGFAVADQGIRPTPETIGIGSLTTIHAAGLFLSSSHVDISITDGTAGLSSIPPLGGQTIGFIVPAGSETWVSSGRNSGATYYTGVYTDNTLSGGQGVFHYTKTLDVDTAAMLTGQSNIEALKQLLYVGSSSGQVVSEETIAVFGAGTSDPEARFGFGYNTSAPDPASVVPLRAATICALAGSSIDNLPAFCNSADAWSSVDMKVVSLATETSTRFITPSADTPVMLKHDIRVIDSIGKASAGISVDVMESRSGEQIVWWQGETAQQVPFEFWIGFGSTDVFSTARFSESIQVDGIITRFDKSMVYESSIRR